MYKLIVLSMFAFSAVAQVKQPPPPAPFLLSNLPPHATQKVIAQATVEFYPGASWSCSSPSFTPACLMGDSLGGNQYDGKGNYYFSRFDGQADRYDSIWKRTPQGTFSSFINVPLTQSCSQNGTGFSEARGGANLWWLVTGGPYGPSPIAYGIGALLGSSPGSGYVLYSLYNSGQAPTDVLLSVNAAQEGLEVLTFNSSAVYAPNIGSAGYCNSSGRFVFTGGASYSVYETITVAIVQVTLPAD